MKLIINTGQEIIFDDEDYELIKSNCYFKSSNRKQIYLSRANNKKLIKLENFILNLDGKKYIKHKNKNYLDFRKNNLIVKTKSQVHAKSKKPKNNKTGYKGIWWDEVNKKFSVRIKCNYKNYWGGRHLFLIDAIKAFNKLSIKHFGDDAYLHKYENGEIIK